MFKNLTHTALAEIIGGIEPVELKGVALLRQSRPSLSFFPTPQHTEEVVQATLELIEYIRICEVSVHRLKSLGPIPVEIAIEEFSL